MSDRHDAKRHAMAAKLEGATGRSVAEWAGLVDAAGVAGFMNAVAWLKHEHGLGHFQARLVAEYLRDGDL